MTPEAYNAQILSTLLGIQADVAAIKARVMSGGGAAAPADHGGGAGRVASVSELESPKGNPTVKFVPKSWTGADYKSHKYSECSPEFLDCLAGFLDWAANRKRTQPKDDQEAAKAKWDELDAARARGWAARLRSGWAPSQQADVGYGGDDDGGVPF